MRQIIWARFIAFVCLLLCSGCSGCFGETDSETGERCRSASLETSEGEPFDRIRLEVDLEDDDHPKLFGVVSVDGLDRDYYTPVERSADGDYLLVTPVHPDGIDGGTVKIEIRGPEGLRCPSPFNLRVAAIPEAPGTLQETIDTTMAIYEEQAAIFGLTVDDLRVADLSGLPGHLWGAAIGVQGLTGEDNSYSLQKIVDGEAPNADEISAGMTFTNALLAHIGWDQRLQEELELYRNFEDPPEEPMLMRSSAFSTRRQGLCPEIPRVFFNQASALSHYMKLAHLSRQFVDDIEDAETAVGYAALLHGGPIVGAAATVVGLILYHEKRSRLAFANTLPSQLLQPTFEASPLVFEEDFGVPDDGIPQWEQYKVQAKSNGWDPTAQIIEGLFAAITATISAKGLQDEILKGVQEGTLAEEWVKMQAENKASEWASAAGEGDKVCYVPSWTWGPIRVTDSRWSDRPKYVGSITQLQGDRRGYEPRQVGPGRIVLKVEEGPFPPGSNVMASLQWKDVEVKPIIVAPDPGHGAIEPGETIRITAHVHNALDRRVMWEVISGGGTIQELDETDVNGNEIAEFTAPTNKDEFPIVVMAESISRGGLRKESPIPRQGFAHFRLEEGVDVIPGETCVRPGGHEEFEARVYGTLGDNRVEWEATGGSIDSETGEFEAGAEGRFEVTATSKVNPDLSGTAHVTVGDCNCFFHIHGTGALLIDESGYSGVRASLAGGAMSVSITKQDVISSVVFTRENGFVPGQAGAFPAQLSASVPYGELGWPLGDEAGGRGTIWSWENSHVDGHARGTACALSKTLTQMECATVTVDVRFSTYVHDPANPLSLTNHCE